MDDQYFIGYSNTYLHVLIDFFFKNNVTSIIFYFKIFIYFFYYIINFLKFIFFFTLPSWVSNNTVGVGVNQIFYLKIDGYNK